MATEDIDPIEAIRRNDLRFQDYLATQGFEIVEAIGDGVCSYFLRIAIVYIELLLQMY